MSDLDYEEIGYPSRSSGATEVVDVTDAALQRMRQEEVFPFSTPVYRPRAGHRALWLALAVVVTCAAALSWFYVARSGAPLTNLSSQVVSSGDIPLNFPQAGMLSAIKVSAGDKVSAGQVIAVESVPGLSGAVTAAAQAVTGDKQEIVVLKNLLASAETSSGTSASQTQASYAQQLAAANNQLATAENSFAAAKTAGVAAVNQLDALIAADQSQVATACAGGGAGSASCLADKHILLADQASLAQEQATVASEEAQAASTVATDQRAIADLQASSGISGGGIGVQGIEADIAAAQNQLTRDESVLAAAQVKAGSQLLRAPVAGTVVSVDGAIGEAISGSGVSNVAPSGNSLSVQPGFQLFPGSSSPSSAASQTAVAVIAGPRVTTLDALVPQSQIGMVRVGERATFYPSASGFSPLRGRVQQVFPKPTVVGGNLVYEVQVSATNYRGSYVDGLTGSTSIQR